MNSVSFSERLQKLRGEDSLALFATKIGVSDGSVKNYFKNGMPSADKALRIAELYGVSLKWLINGEGPMRSEAEKANGKDSPFLGVDRVNVKLSAGGGAWNENHVEIIDQIPFTKGFFKRHFNRSTTEGLVMLEAKGDSMLPTIGDGDLVLVDQTAKELTSDGIYAFVDGEAALVKRFRRIFNKGVEIISDNKEIYSPQEVLGEEVNNLHIIGKVLWCGRIFSQ